MVYRLRIGDKVVTTSRLLEATKFINTHFDVPYRLDIYAQSENEAPIRTEHGSKVIYYFEKVNHFIQPKTRQKLSQPVKVEKLIDCEVIGCNQPYFRFSRYDECPLCGLSKDDMEKADSFDRDAIIRYLDETDTNRNQDDRHNNVRPIGD
jgi:hypothetical protein